MLSGFVITLSCHSQVLSPRLVVALWLLKDDWLRLGRLGSLGGYRGLHGRLDVLSGTFVSV